MAKAKVLEKDILYACKQWLAFHNYTWWRMPVGPVMRGGGKGPVKFSPSPIKGFPDICIILKKRVGILCAVELKTNQGSLQKEQEEWIARLRRAGCVAFVARSLDEMIEQLRRAEDEND